MSELASLVDSAWLAAELGAADLHVLDASFYLPAERIDARVRFAAGHVPGARFFDIEEVADTETDLPHMLPTAGRFSRLVGALGIGNGDRVVVYDQKGIFSAPRAWWMFRLFGHDRVAVLDGGLPAWRAAGQALEAGAPAPASPARFEADFHATRVRGLGDMRDNLMTQAELVLDARPAERFAGTGPEPRPGLPSGHMPGAVERAGVRAGAGWPHAAAGRAACAPCGSGRRWAAARGDELRQRRIGRDPDLRLASGGPARRRAVRRVMDRVGAARGYAEGGRT